MNVNPVVRLEHCGALSANRPGVTHMTTCGISIPEEETINDRCVLKEDNVFTVICTLPSTVVSHSLVILVWYNNYTSF